MKISNITNNYKTYMQTNNVIPNQNYNKKVAFQGFLSNVFSGEDTFIPKKSIIEDEWGYVSEVSSYFSKLSKTKRKGKIASETHRLFNLLKSQQEKKIFKNHFGMHLYDDTSQQNQLAVQTQHIKHKKPVTNSVENTSNKINNPQQQTSSKKSEILSKDTLLQEFESLEKEDIPSFVTRIAKGSKDEQYDIIEIYLEQDAKYRKLEKEDPYIIFKKENYPLIYEKVKSRPEYKNCYGIEHIKVAEKELEELCKKNGLYGLKQETQVLADKVKLLREELIKQNVSFIPRSEFTCEQENPEQYKKERLNYIKSILCFMSENEASAMEVLDIFDKLGLRAIYEGKCKEGTLEDLAIGTINAFEKCEKTEDANKIINRYLDVFNKYASKDRKDKDISDLCYLMTECLNYMTKDTIIKLIETLKIYAYSQKHILNLSGVINRDPELLIYVKKEELPEIRKHLNELEETVNKLSSSTNT